MRTSAKEKEGEERRDELDRRAEISNRPGIMRINHRSVRGSYVTRVSPYYGIRNGRHRIGETSERALSVIKIFAHFHWRKSNGEGEGGGGTQW